MLFAMSGAWYTKAITYRVEKMKLYATRHERRGFRKGEISQ